MKRKILTPYIHTLNNVFLRLYLIEKQSADYGALILTIEFCIKTIVIQQFPTKSQHTFLKPSPQTIV